MDPFTLSPSTHLLDAMIFSMGATFRPLNDPSGSIQHQGMPAEVAFENGQPKTDTYVMGRDAGVHRQPLQDASLGMKMFLSRHSYHFLGGLTFTTSRAFLQVHLSNGLPATTFTSMCKMPFTTRPFPRKLTEILPVIPTAASVPRYNPETFYNCVFLL